MMYEGAKDMILFVVLLAILVVVSIALSIYIFMLGSYESGCRLVSTWFTVTVVTACVFLAGFAATDGALTVETTTEYDVWKMAGPYGTFVAGYDGVGYSADTTDDYIVVYLENGTLKSMGIDAGDSGLEVYVLEEDEEEVLRLVVTETETWNYLGVTHGWVETEYALYLPDPRSMVVD